MTKQERTHVGWSRDAQDAAERASPPPSPEELASDRGARHVGQSELLFIVVAAVAVPVGFMALVGALVGWWL